MYLKGIWASLADESSPIYSQLVEAQVIMRACNWGLNSGTEPLTCSIWCYLWVDGVRNEWNCKISGYWRITYGKPDTQVGSECSALNKGGQQESFFGMTEQFCILIVVVLACLWTCEINFIQLCIQDKNFKRVHINTGEIQMCLLNNTVPVSISWFWPLC